jgi:hypothetical protein
MAGAIYVFARSGFTPAALEQLQTVRGRAVDLTELDDALGYGETYS